MYVGDDVSPDFYGWVFPKYDHVAVGGFLSCVWAPSGLPNWPPFEKCLHSSPWKVIQVY